MAEIGLALALCVIMLAMGLALTVADFRRVATAPKAFAVGAVNQVLVLPLIAFGICLAVPMEPELAVGLMILAACPGGVTSNLLTHLAKGDTALSISLTAVMSLLSFLTIPFIVGFALDWFMGRDAPPLPILNTLLSILAITVVPLLAGMAVKAVAPAVADRIEPGFRRAATALFIVVVVGAVASDWQKLTTHLAQVGPAALALNLATMATGYWSARAFALARPQMIAISLECGLQNGTLAIFIAGVLLDSVAMSLPGAIYGLLMFATAGAFIALLTRRTRTATASAS